MRAGRADRDERRGGERQPDIPAERSGLHLIRYSQTMPALTFLGAAETVTGSTYLLERGDHRVPVDCGLFQGLKGLRLRNWAALPVDPQRIDAVILTHAHLDHCGYLLRLVAGRVEEVIYWLKHLEQAHRIPVLPVYIDSPMAAGALQFYFGRLTELDPDMKPAHATSAVSVRAA